MTKKALLTGSTGGLGREIAKILARDGWDLILLNRGREQAGEQLESLRAEFPKRMFENFFTNLMDLKDIQKVAREIGEAHHQITALYNIAGLLTDKRIESPQGIEGHFVLNAVAPYMLIQALRPKLKNAAGTETAAFVVNFSSSAVNNVKTLDATKLVNPDTIGGLMDAYAKTKAVLNLMSCFLKDELVADGIYIYSVDPGATKTQMTSKNRGMPWLVRLLVPLLFGDAEKQAGKLVAGVHRALEEKETGLFISSGKVKNHPSFVHDRGVQEEVRKVLDSLIEDF
ncbi:SDR family NAD(P)-dependent oxidoreductase [Pseudobacteriovorax antillogorgiicola]|uniref:Short-chain dehydrogenase n=1 Tax=Pseudobacteriovorax antillogorgiicola TaxID=1513793 RepID=A0A1Y6CR03_9BACT|nr:SDR family NAD(P)-dependent oxidoreductase [Pseudobacteriovorax antillogorgiicola]TCS41563.1 short-subunit dehydrogenase [Pseudobacteriovorax antillogorgiicola]SMF83389.1 Short-chain dehydrogenase [Pseudobacteriovorax antillogorgiicola]